LCRIGSRAVSSKSSANDPNAFSNEHLNTYCDTNTDDYAHTISNLYSHPDLHANHDSYANLFPLCHIHYNSLLNPYPHANRDGYIFANPDFYGHAFTDHNGYTAAYRYVDTHALQHANFD
jgi:hypothetical protein